MIAAYASVPVMGLMSVAVMGHLEDPRYLADVLATNFTQAVRGAVSLRGVQPSSSSSRSDVFIGARPLHCERILDE